ncbi:MAG: HlyD family efflux transporter periplasmic adaptor subunit [Planctomycetota bacterium]
MPIRDRDARRRGAAWVGGVVAAGIAVGLGVLAVATLGGADTGDDPAARSGDAIEWFEVRPRSFALTVTESGDLDAAERLEIKNRVEGRPEIIFLVEEGTRATAGDVLVRLDSDELRDKLSAAELLLERARADEVFARQGLEIARRDATSARAAAEVALSLAELELSKWRRGDVPQARRELDLALQKAERQVERTQRDHEVSIELYAQNFISLNDLEDTEIAELEAADGLLTAELALAVYNDYTYETEQQQKQSAVNQARADLASQIAKNQSELERLEADLASKAQTLAIREEALSELQEQLLASEIKAPKDGIVIYGTSVGRRRGDPMAEGRQVRFNETILFLPDTREMVANLAVAEAFQPLVAAGQSVRVTVDARPGQVYAGTVEKVGPLTQSGGWLNPGQREFTARVRLDTDADHGLIPAMRGTGEITVGQVEDALAVPVQAVFTEGEQHFCYVPAGGGFVAARPVEIGRASETLVEIEAGLEPGDRVLLRDPQPGELRESVS